MVDLLLFGLMLIGVVVCSFGAGFCFTMQFISNELEVKNIYEAKEIIKRYRKVV
jgi:hypothetical protein